MGVFYTYLMLFQGAMVGIVLSDNILLLLIFWELTSLSSFLLIGYWKHLPEGRQGARMALAVTGAGGLAMIAGMLILGNIAGSYDLSVILTQKEAIQVSPWYVPALVLILLGCFTKSAQFPFHFWLPHAMAAPTPVSAYLHSATMVKAGIFLMARMWPVLAGTDAWFWLVAGAGLVTMLLGAVIALFKDDLKALLAFSTVSHLGLITMLLGLGTPEAAVVAVFHIINHATFKAALFMTAGIVDHEAHTRDLRRLGGLRVLMPVTFGIAAIASLSMAGLPPFNGFLSKELMLEEAAGTSALFGWVALVAATFSVGYSFRFLAHGFLGPVRDDYPHAPHDPGFGLWAAPALLAVLVVVIGVIPMTAAGWLVQVAASAVTGAPVYVNIYHWHGLESTALWMSVAAVGGGLVLLGAFAVLRRGWDAAPRPEAKAIFDALVEALRAAARALTGALHGGSFAAMVAVAGLVIAGLGLWAFATGTHVPGTRAMLPVHPVAVVAWGLLVLSVGVIVVWHGQRFQALVLVGVMGLIISLGFAYLSAPDLALTQISVEVVTVLLMLIALNFLPKETPQESSGARRLRDAAVAVAVGAAAAALAFAMMTRDPAFAPISAYHWDQSSPGAGGTNAVNTIIVDFRGYDTFGEIIVLGIAALIIFAIVDALLRPGPAADRIEALTGTQAGDRHPMMLVVATRLMLPIALMVAVYLFFRGHYLPGGGFVAGLVVAIALLMQYMASGYAWAAARQRSDHHAIIAAGVLVAGATGIGAWFWDRPFLTSDFGYVEIWPLEKFGVATAALFDLGVFLCVVGAVMLALASLSRIGLKSGEGVNRDAMDIDPSRGGQA
jgi:multicomponent K+:H+ antiporter subunit A